MPCAAYERQHVLEQGSRNQNHTSCPAGKLQVDCVTFYKIRKSTTLGRHERIPNPQEYRPAMRIRKYRSAGRCANTYRASPGYGWKAGDGQKENSCTLTDVQSKGVFSFQVGDHGFLLWVSVCIQQLVGIVNSGQGQKFLHVFL